jgi:Transposase IS116/IS110/IS902 family
MVTRIMALMASLASRCGLSGSTVTAVLASQRENASCSTSFRWIATCIVTAISSSPRKGTRTGQLIPGGVPEAITTARAGRVLKALRPDGAAEAARWELAAALPGDLRSIDARLRETRKKPAVAVAAAGTGLTRLSGVGPVIAAAVIGDVRDVSRFGSRDRFAACNGTAPIGEDYYDQRDQRNRDHLIRHHQQALARFGCQVTLTPPGDGSPPPETASPPPGQAA